MSELLEALRDVILHSTTSRDILFEAFAAGRGWYLISLGNTDVAFLVRCRRAGSVTTSTSSLKKTRGVLCVCEVRYRRLPCPGPELDVSLTGALLPRRSTDRGSAETRVVGVYAVRAMKEFPLVPTIFCVLPIYRSRLRAFLVSGNENI